ncbi:MAG: TfoX/Sxy family protein [Bacteroidales bacterium]|nr:TfoX/Sxy family protein [Bacteroidales bacterium]
MKNLTEAPNIGKTLAGKLNQAGIHSLDELRETGSENALLCIREFDQSACFSMLCALEGAIQGIRWHHLSDARKNELKQFLYHNNISIAPLAGSK